MSGVEQRPLLPTRHPAAAGNFFFRSLCIADEKGLGTSWHGCKSHIFPHRHPAAAGNFFFAGARLFFRSLEAAIFLFSRVARIPEGSLVLPAICTEERITLGAEMADGTVIRGQNEISHPSAPGAALPQCARHGCPPRSVTHRRCTPGNEQRASQRVPPG